MKPVGGVTLVAPITQAIEIPDETALLVNISESAFYGERTHGTYRIEGCKPGESYSTLVVTARRGVIDMGERPAGVRDSFKNTQQFIIHAEDIGVDLVRGWNTDLWGIGSTTTGQIAGEAVRGFAGVFVADGVVPTEQELEQARELLAASDAALAERAHAEWDQFHSPQTIHASWKRAARRLGVDAEWLYSIRNSAALPDCPHCGSKLKTMTAKVCATCHRDVVPVDASEPKAKGGRKARSSEAA